MTAEFPLTAPVESEDPNRHLNFLRDQVGELDQEILDLVARRANLSSAIDAEKARRGMSTIAVDGSTETVGTYMKNMEEGGPLDAGDAASIAIAVLRVMSDVRKRQAVSANEEPGARLQRAVEAAGETVI